MSSGCKQKLRAIYPAIILQHFIPTSLTDNTLLSTSNCQPGCMILLILTLFCCIEALLSSLLMRGDVGDVLGVGQGVPILPGDPGLPGLLGRSGEFTGLVRRGLDFNVMFIAEAFLPWNLTGESLRSTCSLLAVIRQVNFELLIKQQQRL